MKQKQWITIVRQSRMQLLARPSNDYEKSKVVQMGLHTTIKSSS